MYDFFNCRIPVSSLFDPKKPENSNGGNYRSYIQLRSPVVGTYLMREVMSFHGDIEPYPEWTEVTLAEYFREYKEALAANAAIAD